MVRKNKRASQETISTVITARDNSSVSSRGKDRATQNIYTDTQGSASVVSRNGVYIFGIMVFALAFLVVFALCFPL